MRTLALAIAVSVVLGTPAAQALCTTGVECIRERFGPDTTVRNNRIIDSTDRLGDRGRALNPYLAGRNVIGQARRAGRYDSTRGGLGTAATGSAADPLRPGEVRPDVRYTPGTAIDPYTQGSLIPGETPAELQSPAGLAAEPYLPAQPVTGVPGADRSRQAARRDRNSPQGAADLRSRSTMSPGANR